MKPASAMRSSPEQGRALSQLGCKAARRGQYKKKAVHKKERDRHRRFGVRRVWLSAHPGGFAV